MGRRKPKHKLGRALKRKQREAKRAQKQHKVEHARHSYASDPAAVSNAYGVGSVTETSDLHAFLEAAELAERDFAAERGVAMVVSSESAATHSLLPADLEEQEKVKHLLTVPRRPAWDATTTKEELDKAERTSFLTWRAQLAELESNRAVHVTPFEKNLEMWRQLWRVVDRAHIVVQILDARNPELFRCPSLEDYVKDIDARKKNVLLVNKADLLPAELRAEWARHWRERNVTALFFSAVLEQDKLDAAKKLESDTGNADYNSLVQQPPAQQEDEDDDQDAGPSNGKGKDEDEEEEMAVLKQSDGMWKDGHILTRQELVAYVSDLAQEVKDTMEAEGVGGKASDRAVVGLVGYPNVGKSSTINVLYGEKKTSVAATPGKTKHFQTLVLSEDVLLCDCPGLVFPSFVSSKAEMVCSGVLPIDNMRSYYGPVSLVCQRIPRDVLEETYGVQLPPPGEGEDPDRAPYVSELLQSYAYNRGFMSMRGPDESRASRIILKDYVNGKLLYCFSPNQTQEDISAHEAAAAAAAAANAEVTANAHVMASIPGATEAREGMRADIDIGFIKEPVEVAPAYRVTATGSRIVTPGTSTPGKSVKVSDSGKKITSFQNSKMARDRAKIDAEFFAQQNVRAITTNVRDARGINTNDKRGFASKKERQAARAREKAYRRQQERERAAAAAAASSTTGRK